MIKAKTIALILLLAFSVFAQTQTTGRIAGTVQDQTDALLVGATVTVTSLANGDERTTTTDATGTYSAPLLAPGIYRVRIEASGFGTFTGEAVTVRITETTSVNAVLTVAGITADPVTVNHTAPLIKTDNATLGQVIDERTIAGLPLATRNFTQLLGLTAGTTTYLTDNTVVGRNTSIVSVNGSRVTQNNIQINGIDATGGSAYVFPLTLASPAPESIAELKVQTSLYDATFGRAGGGSIQVVTKSGSNKFRGTVYDYFRNTALTANNPFLKAVGARRPVLERNVFGGAFGGAIKKDRAFFFVSYQTTRERNGASRLNSLSVNVLVDPRLTNDRSAATLLSSFPVAAIHPTALALLNARLPNGQFVIPTPQLNGRYSGSAISLFREEQFNANVDYRLSQRNWLSAKFFFSNAPTTLARAGGINVPGFAVEQVQNHRLLAIQDIYNFSPNITNEARIGYNFIRGDNFPQQPFKDSDFGIARSTASVLPGLPSISIAAGAGGIQFGTGVLQASLATAPTTSFTDTISITRGKHTVRLGAEIRYYESNFTANLINRGSISFQTFTNFLTGTTQTAQLGNGIGDRSFRTTDYNFFVQDDWRLSPKLTLNLGLRYELDLPPYETRGRFATFDPSLFRPRMEFVVIGGVPTPVGPPIGGFVQAGDAITQYDLPEVPNVSKRVLNSIDPNNFAPRIGFAYSPFKSNSLVFRGGYGIFYSRPSFQYAGGSSFSPPFYFTSTTFGANVSNPFANVGSEAEFPRFFVGPPLFGSSFDRNNRTPYVQQYNASVQFGLLKNTLLEVAYVGTRALKLFKLIAINQGRLAGPQNPVVNAVTGAVITTNTPTNAQLRAPFQGVALGSNFVQLQTSGRSVYNSLQASLTRRLSRGLQFLASYTYAKSIDDGSATGGGSGTTGIINSGLTNDTNLVFQQFDNLGNRGVSDFDRTHRFVLSFLWELPKPALARRSKAGRILFSNWQMSGIVTAMSGLPIDIIDSLAGTFYLGANAGGARPNFVSGISAMSNIPAGYYFNPFAFARPTVLAGQIIPSSNGTATASATGTDFGNVGRNVLRGPKQSNCDISIIRRFRLDESKNIEFRAEMFNLFNQVNFANPISNFNAVTQSGGTIDANTGRILGNAGDFGKIISTSNNARIVQLAMKFSF